MSLTPVNGKGSPCYNRKQVHITHITGRPYRYSVPERWYGLSSYISFIDKYEYN